MIICAGGCDTGLFISWYKFLDDEGLFEDSELAIFYSHISQVIMFALGIHTSLPPIYPLFYNYIPTMVNRIRVALVLVIFSYCMCAVVEELLVCKSVTNATCLLFHSEMFNISCNGGWRINGPFMVAGKAT